MLHAVIGTWGIKREHWSAFFYFLFYFYFFGVCCTSSVTLPSFLYPKPPKTFVRTLIAIYLITLVMLLVAQIGAGMVAVRFEDNVKEQMFQGWKDSNDAVKVRIWLPPLWLCDHNPFLLGCTLSRCCRAVDVTFFSVVPT